MATTATTTTKSSLKRPLIEISDSNDSNSWVETQAKRLKEANVPKIAAVFLNHLPFDTDRQKRVEEGILEIVKNEVDTLSEVEFKQFQTDVCKTIGHRPLRLKIFEHPSGTNYANGVPFLRNMVWVGQFTWGCSFGHRVLSVWNSKDDPPTLDQLKCSTSQAFNELLDDQQKKQKFDIHVTTGMKELTRIIWNVIENRSDENDEDDDHEPTNSEINRAVINLIMDETQRVNEYMIAHKCTCVKETPVVGVV